MIFCYTIGSLMKNKSVMNLDKLKVELHLDLWYHRHYILPSARQNPHVVRMLLLP